MPFKKTRQQGALPSMPAHSLFIGRTKELLFFVQEILKPEEPTYNILSMYGQGGVGKTTLLHHFKNQAETIGFKDYCFTALIDERQATPASMMEQFAHQLSLPRKFEKALERYREALQLQPFPRPASPLQQTVVRSAPDFAGAFMEGIPVAGPLLREGVKAATEHILNQYQAKQARSEVISFNDPLDTLTQVFLDELNRLAAVKGMLPSVQIKRERRILLFFDTFEQVADEVVPWLLHSVLEREINPNIVFILAGREPLERATREGTKRWLPYYDDQTIYAVPLHMFTQEETSAYLVERGITTKAHIEMIWHLSHGLPLYLSLLTVNTQGLLDPTKGVVDNFLHRIPEEEPIKRQLALDGALFSRPFNLDDLEAFSYLSQEERSPLYAWLLRQPFIQASSLQGRYVYHHVVQELFQRYLFHTSQKTYDTTRRMLAAYYQRVLEHLQTVQEKRVYRPSEERMEIMFALASQRFLLADEESHLQALLPLLDILEYEDAEQTYALLRWLQKMVQILSRHSANSHAYQVAQAFFRFAQTMPQEYNQSHKKEWLAAKDELLNLSRHSSSPDLLANISDYCGWGYMRIGDYQQALVSFHRELELYPHSARVHNGLGFTHYYLKEYHQAIDDFCRGLDHAPHHPHLYLGRGMTYGRLGTFQQALSDLDYAQHLDWRGRSTYFRRGHIYRELKEYGKALADWDRSIAVNPESPWVARTEFPRGCVFLLLKDLPKASADFTHSFEFASTTGFFAWSQDTFLWAREWSAMCQAIPGPQSLHALKTIASGDHYLASVCRGVMFFLQKEFTQALTELQRASTLHYDALWQRFWGESWGEWDAYFWLSMVYVALNQEEEARKAIEQALALEMPPILLKPLVWFEREKPELYEQFVKPLLASYGV